MDRDWTPRQLAADLAVRSRSGEAALIHRWEEYLAGLGVRRAAYGALAIHRHGSERVPLTLRTRLSGATNGDAFDRIFEGQGWLSSPDTGRGMITAAPRLSPHLQVKVTYGVHDRILVPLEFLLGTDWPFRSTIRLEPWMQPVIVQCDGVRTTPELYRAAQATGALPDGFGLNDFAGLIAMLIFKGCLEIEGMQRPSVSGGESIAHCIMTAARGDLAAVTARLV